MSFQEKLNDLQTRRKHIELQGGQEEMDKIHGMNKMSARERMERLFDESSFVEVGAFVHQRATDFNLQEITIPADGVVTGYGTIHGRLVYAYSQDSTSCGGAMGEMHGKKIATMYDLAIKMGAPIVGLLDSVGVRLQEGTDALNAMGEIYMKQSMASGVIPQITGVFGSCGGGAAVNVGFSDITFMTPQGQLFVNSPNTYGDIQEKSDLGTAEWNETMAGTVDKVCPDESTLIDDIRELIEWLPGNNREEAPFADVQDDLNRLSPEFNSMQLLDGISCRYIISEICDQNNLMEMKARYGTESIVALGKMNGITVGFIGNETIENEGRLGVQSIEKITDFVAFCDAFNIPMVTLGDHVGYIASAVDERQGLGKMIAKMTHAFISASVPKIHVLLYRGHGSSYVHFNSKHIGADVVLAWPTAEIAMMDSKSAVRIMYQKELAEGTLSREEQCVKEQEYTAMQATPYAAASRGYIDDIIEPEATRKRVIVALEMLYTKSMVPIDRKRSTL